MNTSNLFDKKDMRYNGWTNYETWSIALFIDNEEYYQEEVREIMKQDKEDYYKEQDIRDFMENELVTDDLNPYQKQLLLSSFSEVNWKEIVKHNKGE